MLETRNLRKVYKPKKGVPVVALDSVSLRFPERGMVFLLGKSGSGKSTLLNLLGGLDHSDGGEIIIKGVSSRDFSQERFDSYRNTYVGFVFQDYNILEEFTVGANIALALELQGKKATDEAIGRILSEVDLAGYGSRKPNELSGGQLQRVAIARALVKNPEIIMADEPTGALDSGTGGQVFDTLKRLSAEKLVIVVSHDREYAEHYADRIIELADGRVVSDVECVPDADASESLSFDGDTVTVPAGYRLSEEDRAAINEYIDRRRSGTKLRFSGVSRRFAATDESKIEPPDPSKFALIKSRLPLHSAFRIGGSSLGHKKFRLFVTIVLSVCAFAMFALVDTFGAYDHVKSCARSIIDSGVSYLSVEKSKKIVEDGGYVWWRSGGVKLDADDIDKIGNDAGVPFVGVYVPSAGSLSFYSQVNGETSLYTDSEYNIYQFSLSGLAAVDADALDAHSYPLLSGRLPSAKGEIAISEYVAGTFVKGGWRAADGADEFERISSPSDMVGRTLSVAGKTYTVVGVVDTGFDLDRYSALTEDPSRDSNADRLVKYVLYSELRTMASYSLSCVGMVSADELSELISSEPPEIMLNNSYFSLHIEPDKNGGEWIEVNPSMLGRLADIDMNGVDIIWADGVPRTSLGENEVIASASVIMEQHFVNDYYVEYVNIEPEEYDKILDAEFTVDYGSYYSGGGRHGDTFRIVGIIDDTSTGYEKSAVYVCDTIYDELTADESGDFTFAVAPMPTDEARVRDIVEWSYDESGDVRYRMQNQVVYELDSVNEMLKVLSGVFLWIGVGFAVFASLMFANFIGTSISYKKQEIGILRAIGARSGDVFNIFFAEGFIISMINFALASIGAFVVTAVINGYVRSNVGALITVLTFGPRQILLVLAISLAVTFVSCYIPIRRIASKRPIDAIRGR